MPYAIEGDYKADGAARVTGLISPAICNALLNQLQADLKKNGRSFSQSLQKAPAIGGEAIELYGFAYPPMLTFLWGLTPAIAHLVGADLLPTYCYFRIYRQGDTLKVHNDRAACEHSMSLTLGYSDDLPWSLDVGQDRGRVVTSLTSDFEDEPYRSLTMKVGDAVIYEGIQRRHGRICPNPNAWSAHLFLHWVDRDGPYAKNAFEANSALAKAVELDLA